MEKKYEIIGDGRFKRVKALRDFGDVKKGDIGGIVDNEENLSHDGLCWIYDDSMVTQHAKVMENATVRKNGYIYGDAVVKGDAFVSDNAEVYANAVISGNVRIIGDSVIEGDANISAPITIKDGSIRHNTDYITIGPLGSEMRFVTFYSTWKGELVATTGCFHGTIAEFAKAVIEKYGVEKGYGRDYMAAIAAINCAITVLENND